MTYRLRERALDLLRIVVPSAGQRTGEGVREETLGLLRRALGDRRVRLREGQWEAIDGLVNHGARLLVVQRTGWGKSVVYFLSTRLLRDRGAGPTLIVSPLLALMRNQEEAANRLGLRAATINSNNRGDWDRIAAAVRADEVDVLLVSPERLSNDEFREGVLLPIAARVGLLVIDEAHCISDWGHDFRPDYLRVAQVLRVLPPTVPVLATTATANDRVVADVVAQLGGRRGVQLNAPTTLQVVRGPLLRESLRLQTIDLPTQAERLAWLAEHVPRLPGSGIIYALTISDAQRVASWLCTQGVHAEAYWGKLEPERRVALERKLLGNAVKVLVATNALGMGFDKPDLGFVIHYGRPGSALQYYQQVGRAGRALKEAYGILLNGADDEETTGYFIENAFPPEGHTEEVLAALRSAPRGFSMPMLERDVNLHRAQIEKVLKLLAVREPPPVELRSWRWYATGAPYTPDTDKVRRLTRLRREEQARMAVYAEGRECLMRFLARELDDPDAAVCGRCGVCLGRPILSAAYAPEHARRAGYFLRRSDRVIQPRWRWPQGAREARDGDDAIPPALRAEAGRALCGWGDGGWGERVRAGKRGDGRFDDALVGACAALLRDDWQPRPAPAWVTCVPSLAHPELVPDLARRLAEELGLPFVPCISKVRRTEPQKLMQNSCQQVRNLEGAFAVEGIAVRGEPVLLVDDMVDSRWTFTVITALLRAADSGPVYPLALCETAGSGGV